MSSYELQKLPLQLLPLLTHSEFEKIKFKNTQGRWEENICPQIQTRNSDLRDKCLFNGLETHQPGFSFFFDFGNSPGMFLYFIKKCIFNIFLFRNNSSKRRGKRGSKLLY